MTQDHELKVILSIANTSANKQSVALAFPILCGLIWTDDLADDHYMLPFCTGVISYQLCTFASGYGGEVTFIQQMASYAPSIGGALYLRANDPTAEYKNLHFIKSDQQNPPVFNLNTIDEAVSSGRLEKERILHGPLDAVKGSSLGFSYQSRNLEPKEKWILPAAVIGLVNGDWHEAMQAYRNWYENVTYRRPYPNKLWNRFSLEGISAAHHYHDAHGYNTDMTRWGHIPVFDPDHSKEYFSGQLDALEHTSYWQWDAVTDEYVKKYRKIATEKAGQTSIVSPDRCAVIEHDKYYWRDQGDANPDGPKYFWGNQGDYGLQGYNESWGGLAAFRHHLETMKEKGYLCTLYINRGEAALSSLMGARHGPEWGLITNQGKYYWAMGAMWEMCLDNPSWRNYLADTCRRLIEETRADGIRIDVFGACEPICYNHRHTHSFARPGTNATCKRKSKPAGKSIAP